VERNGKNGEGYESHLQGCVGGDTRGNTSFGIRSVHVGVTEMEVGGGVIGGISSKSKKRELVVGDT